MHWTTFTAAAVLALADRSFAATNAEWRGRSIYQVLTDRFARTDGSTDAQCNTGDRVYCGGTFKGIENHLDYIQGMGFDAVWISPITAQIEGQTAYGEAYHGYWQQDIFSINSHFGTEQDLIELSAALHDREMYLMLDVVVNHFAWPGSPSSVDYKTFHPFNASSAYHPYCPIDFDNTADTTQLEQCWMGDTQVSLPDLRTEDAAIASQWNDWIAHTVSKYKIDGLRLDSAIEVDPAFWRDFRNAAGVYLVGETYNSDVDFVCAYQASLPGIMDYPTYYALLAAFTTTPATSPTLMSSLAATINALKASCPDPSLKGTFTENHDRPRLAHLNPDPSAARNALVYTLLADGLPIVYQGQEQHYASLGGAADPYNREALWLSGYDVSAPLYALVATLHAVRRAAMQDDAGYLSYRNWPIYNDTTTLAMRKGRMVTVLSNKGSQGEAYTQRIPAGYAAGTEVVEVLGCEAVVVVADAEGAVEVAMRGGEPRVFYPREGLVGSGVCEEGIAGGEEKSGVRRRRGWSTDRGHQRHGHE